MKRIAVAALVGFLFLSSYASWTRPQYDTMSEIFGAYAGIEDTSAGINDSLFLGHWCIYQTVTLNVDTVTVGDLIAWDEGPRGGHLVRKRASNSRMPAGVALEDAMPDDMFKMGVLGYADVKTSSNSTGIGIYAEAGTSTYNEVTLWGGSSYQCGVTASKSGTGGYVSGYVRMWFNVNMR